jgi:GTP-binding protein HflX
MIFDQENAILVGVEFPFQGEVDLEESLAELARLAETAGARVAGRLKQNRPRPDIRYFIGEGKAEELRALIAANDANLVIFDSELTASQARNLEALLAIKVIDRTELILDIFAQHAHSREGKLQVELAQAEFQMTRLTGKGASMSRLGGGIGTRGPGETKLEVDRRQIRKRVAELNKTIEQVRKERSQRREKRRGSQLPVAAIIGYTNAGKSTLLNYLTDAGVLVQDKLFATLDTTTRRFRLPGGQTILLSDTVGFIQKLPHQLVAAFRATLEEVTESDLLLHVVDVSHPNFEGQIAAVYRVLEELGGATKPIITLFNKSDLLGEKIPEKVLTKYQPAIAVSAVTGEGITALGPLLERQLAAASSAR